MVQMLFVKAQETDKPNLSDVHTRFRPDSDLRRCLSSHARPQLGHTILGRLPQLLATGFMDVSYVHRDETAPTNLPIHILPIHCLLIIISRIR